MNQIVIHRPDGRKATTRPDQDLSLSQALFLAGLWPDAPLCSGLGRCGLCRVRFLSDPPNPRPEELRRLGPAALEQGWRLSCLHPARACEILAPDQAGSEIQAQVLKQARPGQELDLAVDLGTTTIHWSASHQGRRLAQGGRLNPQSGLGSEIMSRLAFASTPARRDILRGLALSAIKDIAGRLPGPVKRLAVAGNPTMIHLLLGLDVSGLCRAPYSLAYAGGDEQDLGPDLPRAYIPPLLAPFVGADLSAGLAALLFDDSGPPERPFILADMGTNGEFVLAPASGGFVCASVPMGPALEGVGLSLGRLAGPGAVSGFTLSPDGPRPEYVDRRPENRETPGLTGTGYLSLAALLLRAGLLKPDGRFEPNDSPLAARLALGLTQIHGERAFNAAGLSVPASDLEEILKVKAAFNLALSALLAETGLEPAGIRCLHLAGAMGEHVRVEDLETLGFIPPGMASRTVKAGNASLRGAETLLKDPAARHWARSLPGESRTIELASGAGAGDMFVRRMVFSYVP
ncbi:MAG: DUF4445 domain-containing protein [Desulfovibrionaceae bacterium]|nr:DUF4445 domain-containing protein [Desulfovibrionaceae bacterium]